MAAKKGMAALTIGALGVVFGDIGTSPLYALQVAFNNGRHHVAVSPNTVYGIISLIIWTITLIVSVRYIGFIMRADNQGEGGIMALIALVKSSALSTRRKWFYIFLGLIGVSLFFGDSAITPAISVLSAVEGLKVTTPNIAHFVAPITIVILTSFFWLQRYGTGIIGRLFGPIMLLWFASIGIAGGWHVWQYPDALRCLSPLTAIGFFWTHPLIAFVSMTAVVLAVTGAEALYADMGHFGRPPIARAWFFVVFPALALCYMGQGALILHMPHDSSNLLVGLFPNTLRFAVVVLSTVATLIASQSVISGAFSLTRQAIQLDFLPKMLIRHTSVRETGQVYAPFMNFLLFVLVTLLVVLFGSSTRLANAYGIAVSGTFAADTLLFLIVMRNRWHRSRGVVTAFGLVFISLDLLLISSNLSKVLHGGLFPILVAVGAFLIIDTWIRGQRIVTHERKAMEGSLQEYVTELHNSKQPLKRLPGQAVFIGHHPNFTPSAFRATVEDLHELPEKVVIVTVETLTAAHIPLEERAILDNLGYDDGISHIILRYGFHDVINVPRMLISLRHLSKELDFNPYKAAYFVSLSKVIPTKRHNMTYWRKSLYCLMFRNKLSTSSYYNLPIAQTEEIQSLIKL